jgi:hypothetical protein
MDSQQLRIHHRDHRGRRGNLLILMNISLWTLRALWLKMTCYEFITFSMIAICQAGSSGGWAVA